MSELRLSTQQIVALWLMAGSTSTNIRALVDNRMSFDEIVHARPETLAALGLRRSAIASMASSREALARAEEQMKRAADMGAHIITFWDERYPSRLREIYAPPIILFSLGEPVPGDERAVAIVGTRGATTYGRLASERYAKECAASGVVVVS